MSDDFDLDVDPMLFLALVIEDQIALVETLDIAGDPFGGIPGMSSLTEGVADVARRKIAEAQADLDRLIEADTTWQPAYGTWCAMVYEGADPEDGDYFRCTVHGYLVLGDAYVCEGYQAPPYTGGH